MAKKTAPQAPATRGPLQVRVDALTKVFGAAEAQVIALEDVSLTFPISQLTVLMGSSGSGKSTLLRCVSGLDKPTSGRVWFASTDITDMNEARLARLRRRHVGLLSQNPNFIGNLTVDENIRLPFEFSSLQADESWVEEIVGALELGDKLGHRPAELSPVVRQRAGLARALAAKPDIVLADEPTGALDSVATGQFLLFLRQIVDEFNQTVVVATHDVGVASSGDSVVFLNDGRVAAEMYSPTREGVLDVVRQVEDLRQTTARASVMLKKEYLLARDRAALGDQLGPRPAEKPPVHDDPDPFADVADPFGQHRAPVSASHAPAPVASAASSPFPAPAQGYADPAPSQSYAASAAGGYAASAPGSYSASASGGYQAAVSPGYTPPTSSTAPSGQPADQGYFRPLDSYPASPFAAGAEDSFDYGEPSRRPPAKPEPAQPRQVAQTSDYGASGYGQSYPDPAPAYTSPAVAPYPAQPRSGAQPPMTAGVQFTPATFNPQSYGEPPSVINVPSRQGVATELEDGYEDTLIHSKADIERGRAGTPRRAVGGY